MDINQIRLMVSCGEMMYRWGREEDEDTRRELKKRLESEG